MRTQMIDGNSQSDVTAQDLEELSRSPKHTKTAHLVGHCQKMCQDGAKLQGTTPVSFFCVEICPSSKVTRLGYREQTVTQKLSSQGEYIRRATSHPGEGRYPSNQYETGSVLSLR